MHVVQLMASPFFGGPERQILGLATALPRHYRTTFLSFSESGKCRALLDQVAQAGFTGIELTHNYPNVRHAITEVADQLRRLKAEVVCCSGYKPDLIGLAAGRRIGIPVVSVSHGWTWATWKVRLYEACDRIALRWMDAVVCVSESQAGKVRRTAARPDRIHVIPNAVSLEKFGVPDPHYRYEMERLFRITPRRIVCAGGRLSPEKGFEVLIESAAVLIKEHRDIGFVVFGEGPLREKLTRLIAERQLGDRFILAGFRSNLEDYLLNADVVALSSYTEGLPVIVLESLAASVPVIATAVGGVPEVIQDSISGFVVPSGDVALFARKLTELLNDDKKRREMGRRGRQFVEEKHTFATQSARYQKLFENLTDKGMQSRRTKSTSSESAPGRIAVVSR